MLSQRLEKPDVLTDMPAFGRKMEDGIRASQDLVADVAPLPRFELDRGKWWGGALGRLEPRMMESAAPESRVAVVTKR